MQTTVIFSIIIAVIYFIATLTMNRFIENKKELKTIIREACLVFLSALISTFAIDNLGIATISIKQKGGAAAFISKPEF